MDKVIGNFIEIVKQEIIKKNIPVNDFFDYYSCQSTEDNFNEAKFKEMVKKFVSEYKPKEKEEQKPEESRLTIRFSDANCVFEPKRVRDADIPIDPIPEEKLEGKVSIKCKQRPKSVLNDKEVKVLITSANYHKDHDIVFKVETPSEGWVVNRAYKDFKWLQKQLLIDMPCQPVPEIIDISSYSSKRRKYRQKRLEYFQRFMDFIMQNEEIKATDKIVSFLSIEDRKTFEETKDKIEDKDIPENIRDFETLSGRLIISDSMDIRKYQDNLEKYIDRQDSFYSSVHDDLKKFSDGIKEAIEALKRVVREFTKITAFNKKLKIPQKLVSSFEEIGKVLNQWSDTLNNQKKLVSYHIKHYMMFYGSQNASFNEEFKSVGYAESDYERLRSQLHEEKCRLWYRKEVDKYGIKDMKQVNETKLKFNKDYAFSVMKTEKTEELENKRKIRNMVYYNIIQYAKKLINFQAKDMESNVREFTAQMIKEQTELIQAMSQGIGEIEKE